MPASDLARDLHRGFDGIGACRAGELHSIFHFSGSENVFLEAFQKLCFCAGVHIKPVSDAITRDVVQQGFLQYRIVVPVVQCAGSRQKIDIALPSASYSAAPSARSNTTGKDLAYERTFDSSFSKIVMILFPLSVLVRGELVPARREATRCG